MCARLPATYLTLEKVYSCSINIPCQNNTNVLIIVQASRYNNSPLCRIYNTCNLNVYKSTPHYTFLMQGERAEVRFKLSGVLAMHLSSAHHKCDLRIHVETAPKMFKKVQKLPVCSRWIKTYWGAFENPCKQKGRTKYCITCLIFAVVFLCVHATPYYEV